MGERKGQNKYYPPDFFSNEKTMRNGLDAYHGHHHLRERGKKAHLGIITIRFEMPFNIWCTGCQNHIGMGVRYNAEKQKVGNYYSTPIYEFKMKCHLCDNHFTIKTDPKNLDYEIISGARRQDKRWDPKENEQLVPETRETQRRLYDDAMFKLEHDANDRKVAEASKPAHSKLFQRNESIWKDNFEANSRLRAQFRMAKKSDESILSGGLKLLPESEEDRRLAALLKLRSTKSIAEASRQKMKDIMERPALPPARKEAKKRIAIKAVDLGIMKKRKDETLTSLVCAYSSSSSKSEND